MFSRLFRKHGSRSFGHKGYKKGIGTVQNRVPSQSYHGSVYITHHAAGITVNKQIRGKSLAKRINVCIQHIENCKSRDGSLKKVKKKKKKKKTPRRKSPGFNGSVRFLPHKAYFTL